MPTTQRAAQPLRCQSWEKSLECEKTPSRSLKVTDFVTNQKGICNFLLVVILHGLGARATYWSKSIPMSHLTPWLGVTPREYFDYIAKN